MATQIYRQTTIGKCLIDTLDELIQACIIDPQTALTILQKYDVAVQEALSTKAKSCNVKLKGEVSSYKFLDDVWIWVLKPGCEVTYEDMVSEFPKKVERLEKKVKIVCVPAPKHSHDSKGGISTKKSGKKSR